MTSAWAATPLAASADPALKPIQPNHRMPVPNTVNGRLCGGIGSVPCPRRLPITATIASDAIPALMWIAAPPAKSRAPISKIHPPVSHTQWATGEYTSTDQIAMNTA